MLSKLIDIERKESELKKQEIKLISNLTSVNMSTDGDFAEAFNGSSDGYFDYNVSVSKGGFAFMMTGTDVEGPAADGGYDNDEIKFVVSYAVDISM